MVSMISLVVFVTTTTMMVQSSDAFTTSRRTTTTTLPFITNQLHRTQLSSEPFDVGGEIPAFSTNGDTNVGQSEVSLNPPSLQTPVPAAPVVKPPPPQPQAEVEPVVSATQPKTTTTTRVQWMPEGGIPMYVEQNRLMEQKQVIIDTVATAKGEDTTSKLKLFEQDGGMMYQQSSLLQRSLVRNELPPVSDEENDPYNRVPLFESDGGMMLQQSNIIQSSTRLVRADAPDNMAASPTTPWTSFQLEANKMMYVSKYQAVPKDEIRYEPLEVQTSSVVEPLESAPVTIDIPPRNYRPRLYLTDKVVQECETIGQHFAKFHKKGIMMEQSSKETVYATRTVDPSVIDTTAVSSTATSSSPPPAAIESDGSDRVMPDLSSDNSSGDAAFVEQEIDYV